MAEQQPDVPDGRQYAEWFDMEVTVYENVNKQTGDASLTIYEDGEAKAWVESDVYCDLEDVI